MNFVRKSEVLHCGEHLAKRIENLGHGGYLPVEVPAADNYGKGIIWHLCLRGIDRHVNSLAVEAELGTVEPEVFCSPDELHELWSGKRELLVEADLENLEARWGLLGGGFPTLGKEDHTRPLTPHTQIPS
jgi:hypothetical protein